MSFIVEFFDSIERSITGGEVDEPDTFIIDFFNSIEELLGIPEPPKIEFPQFVKDFFGAFDVDDPLIRKFVSGLFYCNGRKQNHFAVITESDDLDRENELLQELIGQFPH